MVHVLKMKARRLDFIQPTAHKCPAVIDNPTANGADPLISLRFGSDTPFTTKTSIDVIRASITIH